MANTNNPHGLRPLGWCLGGGMPYYRTLSKVVGYGTAIYPFDVVAQVSGGAIQIPATPGTTLISGVALDYGALSKATDHLVCVSPEAVYEAQDDDTVTGIVATQMGLNANLVYSAGTLATKKSGHQIDQDVIDVTATYDVHLLQLLNVPDNAFGPNARIEIVINKHRMNPGVVGV